MSSEHIQHIMSFFNFVFNIVSKCKLVIYVHTKIFNFGFSGKQFSVKCVYNDYKTFFVCDSDHIAFRNINVHSPCGSPSLNFVKVVL